MDRKEIMHVRKQEIERLEKELKEIDKPEDSLFYYHPNEDHIVLSHALFWVMSRSLARSLSQKNEWLCLIRKYQEEMLEAYLTESDEFSDLLHYCNVLFEFLPHIASVIIEDPRFGKLNRKMIATAIIAAGYGGDVEDERMYELLDDIDFLYNKISCRKIEQLLPMLNRLVGEELRNLSY